MPISTLSKPHALRLFTQILEAYGLDPVHLGAIQRGYRNRSCRAELANGDTVNVICFKREDGIVERMRRADGVAKYAHHAKLPVRIRYDDRLLRLGDQSYAGVYHFLPGEAIAWEAYTKKHLKLLGWAMADLHRAVQQCDVKSNTVYSELHETVRRIEEYFARTDVQRAVGQKLCLQSPMPHIFPQLSRMLEIAAALPNQQHLHMDMVRGNVLFAPSQPSDYWSLDGISLSGIIDFEKTAIGLPVCDIARTLAFLLVDCPKPTDRMIHYFLNSGYRKRGRSVIRHRHLLAPFVRLFLLHDFYKFLRHTPYESLEANYHYRRTRDLLLQYGIIRPVISEGEGVDGLEEATDQAERLDRPPRGAEKEG